MAVRTWTVTDLLNLGVAILTARQGDPRLSAADQALSGEGVQVCTLALGRLRPDNTVAAGQRQGTSSTLIDKAHALGVMTDAHKNDIPDPRELFNATDAMVVAGELIARGQPSDDLDIQ